MFRSAETQGETAGPSPQSNVQIGEHSVKKNPAEVQKDISIEPKAFQARGNTMIQKGLHFYRRIMGLLY